MESVDQKNSSFESFVDSSTRASFHIRLLSQDTYNHRSSTRKLPSASRRREKTPNDQTPYNPTPNARIGTGEHCPHLTNVACTSTKDPRNIPACLIRFPRNSSVQYNVTDDPIDRQSADACRLDLRSRFPAMQHTSSAQLHFRRRRDNLTQVGHLGR